MAPNIRPRDNSNSAVTNSIYGLFDPLTGECRYVGKTKASLAARLKGHLGDARRRGNRIRRFAWINTLSKSGLTPTISLLELCDDWRSAEKRWICVMRSSGHRLLNATDGGDGVEGYRHSEAAKATLSAKAKKRNENAAFRNMTGDAVRAALSKPEAKENMRVAREALMARPGYRERLVEQARRIAADPRRNQKLREAMLGRVIGDAWRAKMSESLKGKKRSAESVKKSADGHRGKKHSEETKAKMRAARTPEMRAASAARMRDMNINMSDGDRARLAEAIRTRRPWENTRHVKAARARAAGK